MSWLSYIFPQTVLQTTSPYNKEIRVNLESGRYKLLVNGSRQSGAYIEKLWRHAFRIFELDNVHSVHQILVLGVGGGTVIELLCKQFPKAGITGVDIDPAIIDIGKKYYQLDTISTLRLVCDHAQRYVKGAKNGYFDLVVVDLFSGRDIPDFVRSDEFLLDVKVILADNGILIINYLRELDYGKKSEQLRLSLQKLFSTVKEDPIALNRFFFCR